VSSSNSSASTIWISFFVQAEDGIRDRNVTGVQTCVLPILLIFSKDTHENINMMQNLDRLVALGYPVLLATSKKSMIGNILDLPRSEERRVGKECRLQWSPTH